MGMKKSDWYKETTNINRLFAQVESLRKRRLLALAYCRGIENLTDERSKHYLEKIELFVDGKVSKQEFELVVRRIVYDASWVGARAVCAAATARVAYWIDGVIASDDERFKLIEILRDIYNPYMLDLKFSSLAVSLASQVYEGDASARGILSDYLEEEGYSHEIVMHLKSGEHYKGCWLIDQILGKV